MKKYTVNEIQEIFYSGSHSFRADKQLIVDICFLLEEKLLILNQVKIATKTAYLNYINDIRQGTISAFDAEGGGVDHVALKFVGRDYLLKRDYNDIKFEEEFEGYRPDLMVNGGSIIAECGNTNADKVFCYFKNPKLQELLIIPYPVEDDGNLNIFIFTPGEELSAFLIFRDEERVRTLKKQLGK